MNGNYMVIVQLISILLLILCTGYFVLPHLPRRHSFVAIVYVIIVRALYYEKNENLQIRDFTVFEKYQIWRFTERRKGALLLLANN